MAIGPIGELVWAVVAATDRNGGVSPVGVGGNAKIFDMARDRLAQKHVRVLADPHAPKPNMLIGCVPVYPDPTLPLGTISVRTADDRVDIVSLGPADVS